jgi:hypothetical protein
MEIRFTVKTMEDIIGYWIEAVHIYNKIDELSEYTEDVTANAGFANTIDEASKQADGIRKDAEEKLKAVIESAINAGAGDFARYQELDYHECMDDIMDMLCEQFDDIYGYSKQEQLQNFYGILHGCMDALLVK